jgi:hypothetical protein
MIYLFLWLVCFAIGWWFFELCVTTDCYENDPNIWQHIKGSPKWSPILWFIILFLLAPIAIVIFPILYWAITYD